jgi:hypothetical protein
MSYRLIVGGKITKTTGGDHKMYSEGDIVFNSAKKVIFTGKEKGVTFGKPESPPESEIKESEYKLESKFALEQLFDFAKKDSKAMFCFWMADIFGADIPLSAYEQLYKDASDKKASINPKITVALFLPGIGASYDSNKESKFKNNIIISRGFIDKAISNNKEQQLLLIALVEEFGHHLDYLLRYEYSSVGGDAKNDEGAKYTSRMNRKYKRYLIDPFKNKEQHYATATINGEEKKLIWDFAELNEKLNEFVDNRTEKDDHFYAGYEFFGAGMGDDLHGLGHQAIESVALGKIQRYKDKTKGKANIERQQIYFGNWLRDFSQFVDPMVIRPMANALDMMSEEYKKRHVNKEENQKLIEDLDKLMENNNVTRDDVRTYNLPSNVSINFDIKSFPILLKAEIEWKTTTFSPVKLSREAVTSLVELIGLKEFGELKQEKDEKGDNKPQNYRLYLEKFRKEYTKVTSNLLGVYKPQEHIDNPLALHPKFICEANKKKGKACPPDNFNYKLDPDFVKDPIDSQWNNNKATGTKNYIRGNGSEPFESAFDCFLKFINKSNPNTVEGRINFGAALHILEDYYAHSNFCELAVMKVYDPEVFPWDNLPKTCEVDGLKKHKADIGRNSHAVASVIERKNIKFNTVSNPDLYPDGVKDYVKLNPSKKSQDYYRSKGYTDTRNRGLYYSHAECAIVQTGSFGMLDTLASVAPKINNKMFSIAIEDQEKLKEGERTFNDALIFELLKDISNAQTSDTKESNTTYKGTDDNVYSDVFLKYLDYRDFMVRERWFGSSYSSVMSAFGIFDFVTQYIKVVQNSFYHFLTLSAISAIDDYQTYLDNELNMLENGNWRVNDYGPTHTQVAKDSGSQPLHHLAVELAQEAVSMVGKLFENNRLREIKDLADSTLFVHPMYTDWMDEKVIEWCKNNKDRVSLAHEASIVLYGIRHGYQEIAELSHQINIISTFNTTPEQQKEYKSAISGMSKRWHKGNERLNKLLKKRGLPEIKLRSAEETEKEALKESGYEK